MGQVTIVLSEAERDTVLAALRLLTDAALNDPLTNEIATNAGAHPPLSARDRDALSERINTLDANGE